MRFWQFKSLFNTLKRKNSLGYNIFENEKWNPVLGIE